MSNRPKYAPKPDKRQKGEIDKLHDAGYIVIKTHRLGGDPKENPLDFLVIRPDFKRAVLVEFKNTLCDPFTENETLFLARAGYGPFKNPFQPPEGHVVMAAYRAEDIIIHLERED